MRLVRICFMLFIVPAALAQQSRTANTSTKAQAPLARSSFSASGLYYERVLIDFFAGNFADIPGTFDREKTLFGGLFRQYQEAYGRHCAAFLPPNKVELKKTVCARQQYTVNQSGERNGSECLEYRDEGIGIYTDPALEAAITKLGEEQRGNLLKDAIITMGDQSAVNDLQQLPDDMDGLLKLNSCDSPGLKRFQENLLLFAMGKQPIPLSGGATSAISPAQPSGPFKDQNYTRLLDDLVASQSKEWLLNRYIPGSTSDVVVLSRDAAGRPAAISGKYLFTSVNNRNTGSVTVDFSDGVPGCIYFSDAPSSCKTPDRKIVASYSSGGYPQSEPASIQRGEANAANPMPAAASSQPPKTVSSGGPSSQPRPAAAPAPVAPPTPAPALTADQQRQQRAVETQNRVAKLAACRATFQQGLKDHPDASAQLAKEYASCIQAK